MQPIRIMSKFENKKVESVQPVQINIYQSATQVGYILTMSQRFKVATGSTSPYMTTVFYERRYGRFIEIATSEEQNLIERVKAIIFLEAVLPIEAT